jgi:hypothetical protein
MWLLMVGCEKLKGTFSIAQKCHAELDSASQYKSKSKD